MNFIIDKFEIFPLDLKVVYKFIADWYGRVLKIHLFSRLADSCLDQDLLHRSLALFGRWRW